MMRRSPLRTCQTQHVMCWVLEIITSEQQTMMSIHVPRSEYVQIGGMLFIMELSTKWRPELTWRTFFACAATAYCISSCVGSCVSSAQRSKCAFYTSGGFMSVPKLPFTTNVYDAAPVAALGVMCGLAGALFNWFHVKARFCLLVLNCFILQIFVCLQYRPTYSFLPSYVSRCLHH